MKTTNAEEIPAIKPVLSVEDLGIYSPDGRVVVDVIEIEVAGKVAVVMELGIVEVEVVRENIEVKVVDAEVKVVEVVAIEVIFVEVVVVVKVVVVVEVGVAVVLVD